MSDDAVVLRNYEGLLIRYQPEDKPGKIQPTRTRGISGVLQGDKTALVPEGNERMARRRKLQVVDAGYEVDGCADEAPEATAPNSVRLPLPLFNGPPSANG